MDLPLHVLLPSPPPDGLIDPYEPTKQKPATPTPKMIKRSEF